MNLENIEALKKKLEEFKKVEETLKLAEAEFEKTQEGQKQLRDSLKSDLENLKKIITEEALSDFNDTGEKSFPEGIAIQERKELLYDEKKAFNFALDKKLFLSLDKKAFEKVATSLDLDFVEENTRLLVTFPKDLK